VNAAEVRKMYELEDSYWWFVARRELACRLLRKHHKGPLRILDIGCGTGAGLQAFGRLGTAVGVDNSPLALSCCQARGQKLIVMGDAQRLPFREGTFDAALLLDVLEHIADDAAAVREAVRVLRPGGMLVLTVPAVPALWSEHDEALAHRRRYLRGGLLKVLRAHRVRIALLSYAILALFLPIFLFRMMQRIARSGRAGRERTKKTAVIVVPRLLNDSFLALLRIESVLMMRVPLPFGVSLVAVARKVA
jgi:SAM-dependent methyltransferase